MCVCRLPMLCFFGWLHNCLIYLSSAVTTFFFSFSMAFESGLITTETKRDIFHCSIWSMIEIVYVHVVASVVLIFIRFTLPMNPHWMLRNFYILDAHSKSFQNWLHRKENEQNELDISHELALRNHRSYLFNEYILISRRLDVHCTVCSGKHRQYETLQLAGIVNTKKKKTNDRIRWIFCH